MRPDNFLRVVEAYYYNEQKAWLPWRRLYTILSNIGEETIKETDVMWLPFLDKLPPKNTKPKATYMALTREEILEMKRQDGII